MFWSKRLKQELDVDSSWVLSYGDLMTLLLAVFVMLAAMSDMGSGERFRRVSSGVRQAFGFHGTALAGSAGHTAVRRPLTLIERLEQAGFTHHSRVHLIGPDDEVLAPCDVVLSGEAVALQIAGRAAFPPASAALPPAAIKALRRIAGYLAEGTNRIEVRGHASEGPLPPGVPFRDGLDLSYARGRAVVEALAANGISRERLVVTAWDASPVSSATIATPASRPAARNSDESDRIIEIVVHVGSTTMHE